MAVAMASAPGQSIPISHFKPYSSSSSSSFPPCSFIDSHIPILNTKSLNLKSQLSSPSTFPILRNQRKTSNFTFHCSAISSNNGEYQTQQPGSSTSVLKRVRDSPDMTSKSSGKISGKTGGTFEGLNAWLEQIGGKENTGSAEFQIVNFTNKIRQLTSHLEEHRKDYSSQRGLRVILGKRQRLLAYLSKKDKARHAELIDYLTRK